MLCVLCPAALRAERAARQEEAFVGQSRLQEANRQLEDERAAAQEVLLRSQEHHEAARRTLQVCLQLCKKDD